MDEETAGLIGIALLILIGGGYVFVCDRWMAWQFAKYLKEFQEEMKRKREAPHRGGE